MRVQEVMTPDPVVCTFSCTANVLARAMQELDFGTLPVVDNLTSRRLVGIVTDRDLALRVVADARSAAHMTAQECMTPDPVTCSPENEAEKVLALMAERQVRRVLVVDTDNRVIGIVSLGDLVRKQAISARDLFTVLARICETKAQVAAKAA